MSIRWGDDPTAAMAAGRRANSLVLVHFADPSRPLARQMDAETFTDTQVVAAAGRYLPVRIDPARHAGLFARAVGGSGALASCVLDGAEDVVSLLVGYAPAGPYADFLARATSGHAGLVAARAAAQRRRGHGPTLRRLAQTYETLGSGRRAEETWTRLLAGAPLDAAAAHERLARAAVLRGRNQEARAHLDAWRRLDRADAGHRADRALFTEGLVLAIERRMEESRRAVEASMRLSGDEADHRLYALGTILHELGDDAGALMTLTRMRKLHPRSPFGEAAGQRIAHIQNPTHEH